MSGKWSEFQSLCKQTTLPESLKLETANSTILTAHD